MYAQTSRWDSGRGLALKYHLHPRNQSGAVDMQTATRASQLRPMRPQRLEANFTSKVGRGVSYGRHVLASQPSVRKRFAPRRAQHEQSKLNAWSTMCARGAPSGGHDPPQPVNDLLGWEADPQKRADAKGSMSTGRNLAFPPKLLPPNTSPEFGMGRQSGLYHNFRTTTAKLEPRLQGNICTTDDSRR